MGPKLDMMNTTIRKAAVGALGALVLAAAGAGTARADQSPALIAPQDINYRPASVAFPNGSEVAPLVGDSSKAEEFSYRLRYPNGTLITPHHHNVGEHLIVISGTLLVGIGSTMDVAKMHPMPAGSYVDIPAGTPHYLLAADTVTLQVFGMGPRTTTRERVVESQ
jgi:mannose-6-phosphate isomerase-like protein (cupin superfamily)